MPAKAAPQLDESNSETYLARPDRVKICYLNPNPAQYTLSWGLQTFDGPHVLMVLSQDATEETRDGLSEVEIYGCAIEAFHATHRRVPGTENGWYKVARVRAMQVREETEIVTMLDGRVEGRGVVPAGHWIVRNPDGEQYYNSPEDFVRTYVRAESSELAETL